VRPYTVGTPLNPPSPVKLPHPVKLVPRQRKSYFVPHQSFDIMQMFQNPMMLIMVFGGLMMLAMPYIMVRTSLMYHLSMGPLIPRHRKTWIPNYCRRRRRTKHGFRMLYRAAT
jgi:hypothetical protein